MAVSRKIGTVLDVVWFGYDTVFTLLIVLSLFHFAGRYQGGSKWIRLVSQNSLGIYLLHVLLINLTRPAFFAVAGWDNLVMNILYTLALCGGSLVLALGIKRVPVLRRLL